MNRDLCQEVRAWLLEHKQHGSLELLAEDLIDHVASCTYCSAAIVLMLAELSHIPSDIEPATCEVCAFDLATYIELERDEGTIVAAQELPQIFLHLCVCPECAEIYRMTAEVDAAVLEMPPALPMPRLVGQIKLPHRFIYHMLAGEELLGIARGGDEETVLDDRFEAGYHMTLSVMRQPDGTWQLTITTVPPVNGRIVVTLGGKTFTASFSADGSAVVNDISTHLFTASEGPDLSIIIESV